MTYFWDYILIPLLFTLGLHALLGFWVYSSTQPNRYELVLVPEVEFVEARLVEAPKPKAKPKPRQPKAPPKPQVKSLAKPKDLVPVASDIPIFTDKDSPAEPEQPDLADLSTLFETLKEEELLLQEETEQDQISNQIAIIRKQIAANWSRPPSARNGMEVLVAIKLLPNGEVVDARIVTASSDSAFDRSTLNAINRVGRFAGIKNLEQRLFEESFREINLVFRPEDLLL